MSCGISNCIIDAFKSLNKSDIGYIHFKSTEHLDRSFNGLTDFDLLINKSDYYTFQKFLITHGFKKRHSTYDKIYPGMEDYLFYESDSGMIHHFHVHYELLFGKKYSKNFYLPDSTDWISVSNYHEKYPIKVISPDKEMLLLTFRILLKQSVFTVIKAFLRKHIKRTGWAFGRMLDEYEYLTNRVNEENLKNETSKYNRLINSTFQEFKSRYEKNKFSIYFLLKAKYKIQKGLETYTRYSSQENKKLTKARVKLSKYSTSYLTTGGKVISFVGCDGSGKSTLVSDLHLWLKKKLTVENKYLGKVKESRKKRLFSRFAKILKVMRFKFQSKNILDYCHIIDAKTRRDVLNKAYKNKQRGIYTITDRYPLKEFWSMKNPMDGPKLAKSSVFYEIEKSIYSTIEDYPDILIILDVSVEESIRRKPELHGGESKKVMLSNKVDAIKALPNLPNSIKIDTHQPYDQVLKTAKEFIWNNL